MKKIRTPEVSIEELLNRLPEWLNRFDSQYGHITYCASASYMLKRFSKEINNNAKPK